MSVLQQHTGLTPSAVACDASVGRYLADRVAAPWAWLTALVVHLQEVAYLVIDFAFHALAHLLDGVENDLARHFVQPF